MQQKLLLESFTSFAIAIVRSGTAVTIWAATAEFGIGFALGLVYTINFFSFRPAGACSFVAVLQSPPLFRAELIRRRLFEIHASLTIAKIRTLAAIITVGTAIRVLVIGIARGEHAIYFRYFPPTPLCKKRIP